MKCLLSGRCYEEPWGRWFRGISMFQVDPWEKAVDCERAMRISIDPVHREHLGNIREFWISLANARRFLSEYEFAKEAEAIGGFHTKL
jgi:hypothetical protein